METVRRLTFWLALLLAPHAGAKETMRVAIVPPDGTSYAREMRAWARDVEEATYGDIHVRFYMGGIVGNEDEVGRRIQRGQVDGTASAGMLCQEVMPSFRVLHVMGLFADREEINYVIGRLDKRFVEEAKRSGYVYLGAASMGRIVAFSKLPLRGYDDLKRQRLWRWNLDDVALKMGKRMGLRQIPMPLDEAARALDEDVVDGVWSVPVAALAYGFHARAHYVLDMSMDFLAGCMLISTRFFDKVPLETQQALRSASAKLAARVGSVGWKEDDALVGGIFAKHGITTTTLSVTDKANFLADARAAREALGNELVPKEVLDQVMGLLADYRALHPREQAPAKALRR
jgi:TRAP-type C4-dicarboxylate transport system substrate-binding protein